MHWFLLDGMNIIHGHRHFQPLLPRFHLAAMEQLVELSLAFALGGERQVIVVYDGGALGNRLDIQTVHPCLLVANTPDGQSADSAILHLIHRIRRRRPAAAISAVSNDGGLRAAVRSLRVETMSVGHYMGHLLAHRVDFR
jgi:predicted RNA-binding protein with PIN domain